MISTFRRPRFAISRTLLLAAALCGGLSAAALTPNRVAAYVDGCYFDPVVTLSNGAVINMGASVSANANAVTSIVYTLHGPAGTFMTKKVHTWGPGGKIETVHYVPDNAPNTYATHTVVTTSKRGVAVTAFTTVAGSGKRFAPGQQSTTKSVSGSDGDDLYVEVTLTRQLAPEDGGSQ